MKKYIFSGFEITKEGAFFVIDDQGSRSKISVYGAPFTIERSSARFCIGRYDLASFETFACPHAVRLDEQQKGNICGDCFRFNAFNPSFYHVKQHEISPKQRAYNLAPHNVYLVYFSPKHVKIGISHEQRTLTRWLEQGARIARIIYTVSNAYGARELEETLVGLPDIFEALRLEQKRELLKYYLDTGSAEQNIQLALSRIRACIGKAVSDSPLMMLDNYYLRRQIDRDVVDVSSLEPLRISGQAEGMVGDTLIFRNQGQQFMVSLKKIIGHEVSYRSEITRQSFKPVQTSLF